MSTPKENFMRHVNNDNPRWIGNPFKCFNITEASGMPFVLDASASAHRRAGRGEVGKPDAWGVIWDWPADQPGPTPNNSGESKVIKDITRWREFFDFPSLDNLDWTDTYKKAATLDRETKIVMGQSPRGIFEFSHAMMGFSDALENYLLEPDDMYELLSGYTDWKIKAAGLCIDNLQPDIIVDFSDLGSKTQMFLPPRVWREILKPLYARLVGYIKTRGVVPMLHCDCYAEDICEDMVEIGIEIWQGVTPQNDIPAIVEKTGGKLLLWGGTDMPEIDFDGSGEETIRAHIRDMLDRYAPTKRFLPVFTSWTPVYPHVYDIGCDEMEKYGAIVAQRVFG